LLALVAMVAAGQRTIAAQAALDYDYFKTKVQPIFLTKR
jgi:hypothetical protein